MTNPLVSSQWLHDHLNDPNLIILDASQKKNISGEKSKLENKQIKGARKFDIKNTFSDQESDLPNTIPSPEQFQEECRKLGINKNSKIVAYDNLGIYTSPRVWYLFKIMGHKEIAVLDGGLPEWDSNGFEIEEIADSVFEKGDFEAKYHPDLFKSRAEVKGNLKTKEAQVLDARSAGRFDGTAQEPRVGLPSGHIPQSTSLPYTEVLENGKYKSKEELKALFDKKEIDDRPMIFTCGSGITACVIMLASELVLENEKSVFDGSWTEWAQREEDLIELG